MLKCGRNLFVIYGTFLHFFLRLNQLALKKKKNLI